jgi:hypothetical protein
VGLVGIEEGADGRSPMKEAGAGGGGGGSIILPPAAAKAIAAVKKLQ